MTHPPFVRITSVEPLSNLRLLVGFETGERRVYDANWVLREEGELVLPLRDPNYFQIG